MKVIKFSALLWALILSIGVYSVYSSYTHVKPATPKTGQVCYNSTGEDVRPEYRADSTLVRVNWITGHINYNGKPVVGLSKYIYDDELNASICEVWVPMPQQVLGDADMDTLGHEFLHCVSGAFHK